MSANSKPPTGAHNTQGGQTTTKQNNAGVSYAQVATSSVQDAIQQRGQYHVKVLRTDRATITKEDQWSIQFKISDFMVKAIKEGKTGEEIAHAGTKRTDYFMQVFCNPTSGIFYKKAINTIAGFEAYLPGEFAPGNELYARLPRIAVPILDNLTDHFSAGTFGAIKPNQVKISRKPWHNETSSIHVYLEVDDEAFKWLKEKLWMSAIGLHIVRWSHVPIKGIRGYIAPDEEPKALKERLLREQNQENTPAAGTPEEQDRDTHMTGEDKTLTNETQVELQVETPEETESAEVVTPVPEELKAFHTDLTAAQEAELLQEVENHNNTVIFKDSEPRSSTPTRRRSPTTPRSSKNKRGENPDGTPYSDPSESEEERILS